jgi:proliferating cell nuclear antigen PCNA
VANEIESINIYTVESDSLNIDVLSPSGGNFNKYFKIPLLDIDYDLLDIPDTDYNAEFSIGAKKICEIIGQMLVFGTDINVKCSEEKIDLIASGLIGEMKVNIPIEDLTEFSINEGETIDLSYSLTYISKMCLTNKLSDEISFSISEDCPMKIRYDLGGESSLTCYIAPKMKD